MVSVRKCASAAPTCSAAASARPPRAGAPDRCVRARRRCAPSRSSSTCHVPVASPRRPESGVRRGGHARRRAGIRCRS
ncbi:hypothetical protein ACFPRL_36625 [Pseudoclavibacter helvolus]